MDKVYIVLVNYNGSSDTMECLESLLKLTYADIQIFVIDNSETLEPLIRLQQWASGEELIDSTLFPDLVMPFEPKPVEYRVIAEKAFENKCCPEKLVFIKADMNKGFAAANNIALRHILDFGNEDSFTWLLNNDTVVAKKSLGEQIKFFHGDKNKTGILGSRLLQYYAPEKIQAVGGKFNLLTLMTTHIGENCADSSPKSGFRKIDYPIGASMLVPMAFLKEIGILNEEYFLYFEEIDWVLRGRKYGWLTDWCENSWVYHKEGRSTESFSGRKVKSSFIDIQSFRSRNKFYRNFFRNNPIFYLYNLLIISNRIRKGEFKRAYDFFNISFFDR